MNLIWSRAWSLYRVDLGKSGMRYDRLEGVVEVVVVAAAGGVVAAAAVAVVLWLADAPEVINI